MQEITNWVAIIGLPVTLIGVIINFISLFKQNEKIQSMQQTINIYSKFMSNQNNSTVNNIQINSSDMSQNKIADLFQSLKQGAKSE